MTYIIAEPCIDIKDRSCVDVCPVDCIHEAGRILVIDPEECIDCGACEPECPVEAIFPEDALPEKWEPFVKINYAYGDGADVINKLVDEYATEHNVQNEPLEQLQIPSSGDPGSSSFKVGQVPQNAWSAKRERQYEHIKDSEKKQGRSTKRAKEIAARTVNKERARSGEAREKLS